MQLWQKTAENMDEEFCCFKDQISKSFTDAIQRLSRTIELPTEQVVEIILNERQKANFRKRNEFNFDIIQIENNLIQNFLKIQKSTLAKPANPA